MLGELKRPPLKKGDAASVVARGQEKEWSTWCVRNDFKSLESSGTGRVAAETVAPRYKRVKDGAETFVTEWRGKQKTKADARHAEEAA